MDLVATEAVVEWVQAHGGALYVWPRKARCCGGTVELRASTERPDNVFRRLDAPRIKPGIELYLTVGMPDPESLHLELSRRGRVRAFWNGLAWVG
jgi:hypothetical protein